MLFSIDCMSNGDRGDWTDAMLLLIVLYVYFNEVARINKYIKYIFIICFYHYLLQTTENNFNVVGFHYF